MPPKRVFIDVDDPEIEITGHKPAVVNLIGIDQGFRNQSTSVSRAGSSTGPGTKGNVRAGLQNLIDSNSQQNEAAIARKRAAPPLKNPLPHKRQHIEVSTRAPVAKTPVNISRNQNSLDSAKLAIQAARESSRPKRKEQDVNVIDLCGSSDEDVKPIIKKSKPNEFVQMNRKTSVAKRVGNPPIKTSPHPPIKLEDYDSEDEYENAHAALDTRDELNWNPLPRHETDVLTSSFKSMALEIISAPHTRSFRGSFKPRQLPLEIDPWDGKYYWTALQKSNIMQPPRVKQHQIRPSHNISSTRISKDLLTEYDNLTLRASFHKSSGSINRVSQNGGIIAICSAADGGDANNDTERLNPHNKANTLTICRNDELRTCRRLGHNGLINNGSINDSFEKFYTVNNVQFDPNRPGRMASSGNDCTVRMWRHLESFDDFNAPQTVDSRDIPDCLPAAIELVHTHKYPAPVHDIVYRPTDLGAKSILAAACGDGKIYMHSSDGNSTHRKSLALTPPESGSSVGAILWGREATSHFLFASSEADDGRELTGVHRAVDVNQYKFVYTFSAEETGDAMAVDNDGDRLALFTRGGEEGQRDSNILRLYDIKRKNGRHPIFETELEAFPIVKKVHAGNPDNGVEPWVEYIEGEVTCSVFSPDGIYLAVARNDNEVHVYDSRNLGRGVLYRFCHQDPNRDTPGYRGYGIVEAQWAPNFDGRGLGLISGGNDGCVRLWDVSQAAENPANGRVLARTDFDVGHFSLGDKFKGEAPLVIGDSGGGISIFDRLPKGL